MLTAAYSAAVAEVLAGPIIGQGRACCSSSARGCPLDRRRRRGVAAGQWVRVLQLALQGAGGGGGDGSRTPTPVCRSVLEGGGHLLARARSSATSVPTGW